MTKKPTQTEIVLQMLQNGIMVTGSNAYQTTKKLCGIGTLNLHKIIASITKKGFVVHSYWADGHTHKVFMLDRKQTSKKLLK